MIRLHGQALEVPAGAGSAGDGVADHPAGSPPFGRHAEPGARRGGEGIGEAGSVETPERGEGGRVDLQHAGPVGVVAASELDGHRLRQVVEGSHEQVEPLVDLEPGLEERELVGHGERARDGGAVPAGGEVVDGAVDGCHRRTPAAGGDVGDGGVAAPGGHAEPGIGARQEAVAGHRRNGTGAS